MLIDTSNLMSMSEANQNFSLVARRCEERGPVVILKNNRPRFLLLPFWGEGMSDWMHTYRELTGGTAMRKLTYRTITTDRPDEALGLSVAAHKGGVRLDAALLDDRRAARQAALFAGYAALGMAQLRGIRAARDLLRDEGAPAALPELRIPRREDGRALLATWFAKALTEDDPARRAMHLYNAWGALPGGYARVRERADLAGAGQGALLLDAVAWARRDEDDSGDLPDIPAPEGLDRIDADAHLRCLAALADELAE